MQYNRHLKRYSRNVNVSIPPNIFLYCLLLFKNKYFKQTQLLDLDHIYKIPESPFTIFRIELDRFYEMVNSLLPKISKKINISRTAGIKTISLGNLTEVLCLDEIYDKENFVNLL
ncbi:MAG: DUF4007 family protein [Leptospiraceae bacterium]|nr:DUF4007 family protein [Leptospiraceae bacterium]